MNPLEWCGNVANGSEMHCIGSNQCEMGWNMEFGLEFGSAGPIWMRLLFIWPKPNFNGYALTIKSIPTFQPAGMRLLHIIAAGFCNFCNLTYKFHVIIICLIFVMSTRPSTTEAEASSLLHIYRNISKAEDFIYSH